MWGRIWEIVRKEFYQTFRDPRSRALLFGPPLLQLIIFGYAVNMDVDHARTAWLDMDRTPQSRELLAAFELSRYFRITAIARNDREIQDLMDRGSIHVAVRVLPGFARDIANGEAAPVQILVDGTNSNTAAIISGYATRAVAVYESAIASDPQTAPIVSSPAEGGGPAPAVIRAPRAQSRVWFNPDLKSRDYFVPGVIVNIIALVTIMLTAMSIVREKEIGTMEQLMVTPIRPLELILGKLLPFAIAGVLEMVLVVAAAILIFETPLRGSIPALLGGTMLFLFSTLGVGLFLSTISATQQQAMMSSFLFFLPAILLSGFAFPIRNMPVPVQYLTYLNPLRYFMQIVRNLFLKGVGITALSQEMIALALFGAAVLGLSAVRFRRKLD